MTEDLAPTEPFVAFGSYRYAPANIVDAAALQVIPSTSVGGQRVDGNKFSTYIQAATTDITITEAGGPGSTGNHLDIMRQNKLTDIAYPGSKVMFFMSRAWHNPDKNQWFEEGVTCTVALADGSARVTIPQVDGIPYAGNPRTNAGPITQVRFVGEPALWDMHYWFNNGGVKGREISTGG